MIKIEQIILNLTVYIKSKGPISLKLKDTSV